MTDDEKKESHPLQNGKIEREREIAAECYAAAAIVVVVVVHFRFSHPSASNGKKTINDK